MNNEEEWMEDVFQSMKGSQRASPSPDLFVKITNKIETPKTNIISMRQWSTGVAAAVIVLVLNVFASQHLIHRNELNATEMVVSDNSDQSLISNYKIYE